MAGICRSISWSLLQDLATTHVPATQLHALLIKQHHALKTAKKLPDGTFPLQHLVSCCNTMPQDASQMPVAYSRWQAAKCIARATQHYIRADEQQQLAAAASCDSLMRQPLHWEQAVDSLVVVVAILYHPSTLYQIRGAFGNSNCREICTCSSRSSAAASCHSPLASSAIACTWCTCTARALSLLVMRGRRCLLGPSRISMSAEFEPLGGHSPDGAQTGARRLALA